MNKSVNYRIARGRLAVLMTAGMLGMFAGGLLPITVQAQSTTTWINVSGGVWSDVGNWNNGVPNLNDAQLTNKTASYTVTYDATSPMFTNLTVLNAASYTTTLDVASGTLLVSNSVAGNVRVITLGAKSVLNVNPGGSFNVIGTVYNANRFYITEGAQVNINGGTLSNSSSGRVVIGDYSSATVTINSGLFYSGYETYLGVNAWSENLSNTVASMTLENGQVEIGGSASFLVIGRKQIGRVVVRNGSFYFSKYDPVNCHITVGMASSGGLNCRGLGTFDVYGGTVTNLCPLYIARGIGETNRYAEGYVTVTNGVWCQQANVFIGLQTNDIGVLMVTNQGVFNMVGTGSNIYVSVFSGNGTLTVAGGRFSATNTATNTTVYLGGSNTFGIGTMKLSGGTATVDRLLLSPYVATGATGMLEVSRGRLETCEFSCTNGSGNPKITFRMDGTANGTVAVTNAALAGTLTLVLTNLPSATTIYQLFSWGSPPTGSFGTTNIQGLTGHYRLDCSALYTDGTVTLIMPSGTIVTVY